MIHTAITRRSAGLPILLASFAPTLSAQGLPVPSSGLQQGADVTAEGVAEARGARGDLIHRAAEALDSRDALTPIHGAAADNGVGYGLWAAGGAYKASFHDGATFVPLLGKDYPHNQPWSWSTESVRLGAVELVTQAPQLSHGSWRAEYALGQVTEAYDVRTGGIEQTFVIPQRVAAGDLVVQGVVRSMLQAQDAAPAHQPLSFRDHGGRELVTYGAATAVDALGNTRAMTTSLENGRVTLRLDGAWLASAQFPVVVDPLVGPGATVSGQERYEVDVVRCAETNVEPNWVAYTAYASASDADLYFRRFEDDGSLGSTAFIDVTASWSTRNPALGYNANSNHAVMAFDRYFAAGLNRGVRVHRHLRSDYASNTTYTVLNTSGNAWRPDVGGTRNNSVGDDVMVVWQEEANVGPFSNTSGSDVMAATYDAATGQFGTPFAVASSALADHDRPSINQTATGTGANNSWLVTYQYRSTLVIGGTDDLDIAVREVDVNGGVSAAMQIDSGSGDHKFAPKIEGADGRYLVAFVTTPLTPAAPSGTNGRQLRVVRVDWPTGAGAGTAPHGTVVLQSNSDDRLEFGGLAFDRNSASHWAILFRSNVTESLYLRTVGYRGRQLQAETVYTAPAGSSSTLGGLSFDAFHDAFTIAYAYKTGTLGYATTDRFVYPSVTPAYTVGTGCSTAAISWLGSQQIGTETGFVRVNGAANDSIHIAALATAPASAVLFGVPPIQNGCWLLVANTGPDFLGLLDIRLGATVSWNLPLPEFLNNDVYYVQGWHTVGNGSFDFVSTERLTLPTVK